jgi:hypothetical protein
MGVGRVEITTRKYRPLRADIQASISYYQPGRPAFFCGKRVGWAELVYGDAWGTLTGGYYNEIHLCLDMFTMRLY